MLIINIFFRNPLQWKRHLDSSCIEGIAHPIKEFNGVDVTHRERDGAVMRMDKHDTLWEKHQLPYKTIKTSIPVHNDYMIMTFL